MSLGNFTLGDLTRYAVQWTPEGQAYLVPNEQGDFVKLADVLALTETDKKGKKREPAPNADR